MCFMSTSDIKIDFHFVQHHLQQVMLHLCPITSTDRQRYLPSLIQSSSKPFSYSCYQTQDWSQDYHLGFEGACKNIGLICLFVGLYIRGLRPLLLPV